MPDDRIDGCRCKLPVVIAMRTRLALPIALALVPLGAAACGSSATNSLDTLPPIRTTTSTSTTSTTLDPRERIYIVQPGDSVNKIAAAYEVRAQGIIELNNLPADGTIQPGQELKIPNEVIMTELPSTSTSTSEAP